MVGVEPTCLAALPPQGSASAISPHPPTPAVAGFGAREARGERLTRAALAELPDGEWSFEDWIDDDGVDYGVPIRLFRVSFSGELGFEINIQAEFGRSAWNLLRDTGATQTAVLENMRRLKIDPTTIRLIALSHGHDDHTSGLTIRAKVNHLDPNAQKDASLNAQLNMAGYDSLGACIFAGFGYAATPDAVVKRLLEARYGWQDLPDNILQAIGKEVIKMEREFNKRAGFTKEDDRLPKWMT